MEEMFRDMRSSHGEAERQAGRETERRTAGPLGPLGAPPALTAPLPPGVRDTQTESGAQKGVVSDSLPEVDSGGHTLHARQREAETDRERPQPQPQPQPEPEPEPEVRRRGLSLLSVDGVRQAAGNLRAEAAIREEKERIAAEEEKAAAEAAYEQQMVDSLRAAHQSQDLDAVLALAEQLEDAHAKHAREHQESDELNARREECAAAFAMFDTDGDGVIVAEELQLLAAQLGLPLADGDLQSVMTEIDNDGSEEITLDEFTQWWTKVQLANTKAGDALVILKEQARSMLHKERIYSGEKQHITNKQIEAMLARASVAVDMADFDAAIETYHALLTFRPTDVKFRELLHEAEIQQQRAQYEQDKKESAEALHMQNVARIEKAFCNFKNDREDRKVMQQTMEEAIRISNSSTLTRLGMPRRVKTELHRRLYRLTRDIEPLQKGSEQSIAAAEAAVALHEMNIGAITASEAPAETMLKCLEALMSAFEPVAPVDRAADFLVLAAKQEIAGAYSDAERSYASAVVALRDSGDRSQLDEALAGEERVRSLAAIEEFPGAAAGLRRATQRAITHGVFITAKSNSAWAREVGILDRARAVAMSLHHAHSETEVEHAFVGLGRATVHHLGKTATEVVEIDPDAAKIWHSDLELVLDLVGTLEGLVRILEHKTKAEEMEHTLGTVPINKLGTQLTRNLVTAASQIKDPTREYMSVFEQTCIHVGGLSKFTTGRMLAKTFDSHGRVLAANVRVREGQNNSWGLVSFAHQEEAAAAVTDTTTAELQQYKRAHITKQQAMRSAGSFAEVCKKQRHEVEELLQREHIAGMPCIEVAHSRDGGRPVLTKFLRRSDVHDLVCQMLGDGYSEPDLDSAMKDMGAIPAPKADTAKGWQAAVRKQQVAWGDDMVTLEAFQQWWAAPTSPQHTREAAAAKARGEEAKAEAEAAVRDGELFIHRSHYNVFELSWNAAQAELARRSEVHDGEREEVAKLSTSASALWDAWLDTPGSDRRRTLDEIVQALELAEGLIAPDGIGDDAVAEARERMGFVDEGMRALGKCDMERFKKLQKRVYAAVSTKLLRISFPFSPHCLVPAQPSMPACRRLHH